MNRRSNLHPHAHPLLRLDLQRWRARLTLGLLFAGFVALSARAVYLQVWQSDLYLLDVPDRILARANHQTE